MADRDPRNKKFYPTNKDKKDVTLTGPRRQPIILAKPDRDLERDKDRPADAGANMTMKGPEPQPTIILQQRRSENRTLSPNHRSSVATGSLKKETESQPPVYHLAAKHAGGDNTNPLAPPPEMRSSVKLLDENLQFCDGPLEFLLDQHDFMVVGCIGLQGVGKSTIMSLIAGHNYSDPVKPYHVFKPSSVEQCESAAHCTVGVDLHVTSNRTILLDTQPLLSASVTDRQIHSESKKFAAADYPSDNAVEVQSLQLTAFLLSVCHVVLVVQDWFFDPNLLRFLQCAEMLKPSTPTTTLDEEIVEYFPHVVFVQNRATMSNFSQSQVKLMQNTYSKLFAKSRLHIDSGMGIATGNIVSSLSPKTCGELVNLYLLTDTEEPPDRGHFKGHPGVKELADKLREQLLGVARNQLTQTVLSEKNWFHYSGKVWEAVRKSPLFSEYSRLLP